MTHPRLEKLKAKLVRLQPKQSDDADYGANYDLNIDFILEKVVNDVANYTHIADIELPIELDNTIVFMASNFVAGHDIVSAPKTGTSAGVSSLTEGDTSVTFDTTTNAQRLAQAMAVNAVTDDVIAMLNNFRRVKR